MEKKASCPLCRIALLSNSGADNNINNNVLINDLNNEVNPLINNNNLLNNFNNYAPIV